MIDLNVRVLASRKAVRLTANGRHIQVMRQGWRLRMIRTAHAYKLPAITG